MTDAKDDALQFGSVFVVNPQGHKVNQDPDSRDAVGNQEATRDPIFLVQKREVLGIDTINGLTEHQFFHDDDGDLWVDADLFDAKDRVEAKANDNWRRSDIDFRCDAIRVDNETMVDRGWAIFSWRTESVWFRRPEAEAYAVGQRHNLGELGQGCRVYCVCAEGRLADLLKIVHNKEIEAYLHSNSFRTDYAAHRKAMETMIGAKS